MIDKNTFIGGILTLTAVILLVALVLVNSFNTNSAVADVTDRGGDYIMITGAVSNSTEELYVINLSTGRLNLYRMDINKKRLVIDDRIDLDKMFR